MVLRSMAMLKGLVVSESGQEDISLLEVKELIGVKGTTIEGGVMFDASIDGFILLCYKAQSAKRVLLLVCDFAFGDFFKDVATELKKSDLSKIKNKKILVEGLRIGKHSFNRIDAAQHIAKIIGKKIDYDTPDVHIFVYVVNEHCYIGIDLAGFDLSKREYKIFSHAASLKGTIAYGALRLAGFDGKKKLLSCFSKSGVFEIEAALFASGKAVNFYRKDKFAFWKLDEFKDKRLFEKMDKKIKDKKLNITAINNDLRHVSAGQKNAKIAGIEKQLGFSRMDVDWLDVKFKEGEIGLLVAQPVAGETAKMKEFFHQAQYVVSKKGKVLVVSHGDSFKELAEKNGFKLVEERVLKRGESVVRIEVFGKI